MKRNNNMTSFELDQIFSADFFQYLVDCSPGFAFIDEMNGVLKSVPFPRE